jgi:prevent-host-death family protein
MAVPMSTTLQDSYLIKFEPRDNLMPNKADHKVFRSSHLRVDLVYDLVYLMGTFDSATLQGGCYKMEAVMISVNVHEAKTHLSRLLERVAAGEEILISKAGKPMAKLIPISKPKANRVSGLDKGLLQIPDDFDAPLPDDVLELFES